MFCPKFPYQPSCQILRILLHVKMSQVAQILQTIAGPPIFLIRFQTARVLLTTKASATGRRETPGCTEQQVMFLLQPSSGVHASPGLYDWEWKHPISAEYWPLPRHLAKQLSRYLMLPHYVRYPDSQQIWMHFQFGEYHLQRLISLVHCQEAKLPPWICTSSAHVAISEGTTTILFSENSL